MYLWICSVSSVSSLRLWAVPLSVGTTHRIALLSPVELVAKSVNMADCSEHFFHLVMYTQLKKPTMPDKRYPYPIQQHNQCTESETGILKNSKILFILTETASDSWNWQLYFKKYITINSIIIIFNYTKLHFCEPLYSPFKVNYNCKNDNIRCGRKGMCRSCRWAPESFGKMRISWRKKQKQVSWKGWLLKWVSEKRSTNATINPTWHGMTQ